MKAMPIPAYFNAFLITCGLRRRSVLNKTQMRANKLQFRSPGFEALPGIAAGAMIYWPPIPDLCDRQIRVGKRGLASDR